MKIRLSIRIFLLSLAALVLFNGFGFYAFAYVKTGIHRVCFRENAEKMQKLILDSKDFSSISWIGRTDFIYKGRVYDCESIYAFKGKITVSCFADHEETAIKNSLADSFDPNAAKSSSSAKDILKFFPVFPLAEKIMISPVQSCDANSYAEIHNVPLSILHREISSPPPELA